MRPPRTSQGFRPVTRTFGAASINEAEAKAIIAQLVGKVDAADFALPQSGPGKFDEPTTEKLAVLANYRQKLELLPGVTVREKAKLAEIEAELHKWGRALATALTSLAQDKAAELETKLKVDLAPHAGVGNGHEQAVELLRPTLDPRRWSYDFSGWRLNTEDVAGSVERLIQMGTDFLAGKPN